MVHSQSDSTGGQTVARFRDGSIPKCGGKRLSLERGTDARLTHARQVKAGFNANMRQSFAPAEAAFPKQMQPQEHAELQAEGAADIARTSQRRGHNPIDYGFHSPIRTARATEF